MVDYPLKCFYQTKQNCLVEFIAGLHGDFLHELELPAELLPANMVVGTNVWEVTDARGVLRSVKMERVHDSYVWALGGTVWTELVSTVIHLEPKFVHFDQITGNKFLVNFYTETGEEVGYHVIFGHVSKCVVLGCEDPRLYQPIPYEMMVSWKQNRDSKCVKIEVDGIVWNVGITFRCVLKESKLIGTAFTGEVWESLCESMAFSDMKVLIISPKGDGDLFVGKVMEGFVADPVKMFGWASPHPGVSSSSIGGVESPFTCEFISCIEKKQYLNIPVSFHKHQMRVGYRQAWVKADGYSFYMMLRIHGSKKRKGNGKKHVLLLGEWDRLQAHLDLSVGDKMVFQVVSGSVASDGCLSFGVSKLV